MRKSLIVMVCLGGIYAAPVMASSDEAWQELAVTARNACTKGILSSGGPKYKIQVNKVTGTVSGIGGDDGDLYYAMTLVGTAAGSAERWLCLFNKVTKKAQAVSFDMN